MATTEPEDSEPSTDHQSAEGPDELREDAAMTDHDETLSQVDGEAANIKPDLPTEVTSSHSQSQDETLSSPGHHGTPQELRSALQTSQVEDGHGAALSSEPKLSTPILENDPASPQGFAFARLDRRNIELGGKRRNIQQAAQRDGVSSADTSSSPAKDARNMVAPIPGYVSSQTAAVGSDTHQHQTKGTSNGSDALSDGHTTSTESQANESLQYQVDEQIYQEASMSDDIERRSSPAAQSEDVVYIGANIIQVTENAPSGSSASQESPHVSQPLRHLSRTPQNLSVSGSGRPNVGSRVHPGPPTYSVRSSSLQAVGRRPIPQPHVQPQRHAPIPTPSPTGMQELLEVVEYKFKQNEQQLRHAFSTDSDKLRRELQQAFKENDDLRSQLATFEDRCDRSEAAIVKYKNQIAKAKSLQKFLDGLGNDLSSLKRSYDAEKSNFARRVEVSETEIIRLESTLAGKNDFEKMLSHSKSSLEKLLEAKGFELQSVVQHRDMLRNQLEERIGQLVEERDKRLRLEQLVAELSGSERSSLATSIEQCATSLMSKFSDLGRQDDQLVVGVAGLQDAIQSLAERPSVSPDDFEAIRAAMQSLWLQIAQGLSVEASTNNTVAEVSSSVEGIIQHHVQTLQRGLDRLELASKQTASTASAQAALQLELQGAADRLELTKTQLEAAKQREASLQNALVQSEAQISELEARPVPESTVTASQITSQDVENKVNEAVAEARKQLSNSANAFIAQEKARYSNELKKAVSEQNKAVGELHSQQQKLGELQSELQELRSLSKASTGQNSNRQLDDMRNRFRVLEEKYNVTQLELGQKGSLESSLAAMRAERETAQAKLSAYETKLTALTQEIEHCNASLLQARAAEKQAKMQIEATRTQSQSDLDDLRRELSQAEERSRYAEAGLAQMKTSAEKTISDEQEKHRRQREALQKRLDEAQSELQMKSDEADDTRAFVERTVTQQQAVWQRSYAEVESKASDYKARLEEKARLLDSTQKEQDTLRVEIARLQAETQEHHRTETERRSHEDIIQSVIDDLRNQLDTARTEVSSLQAVQQRYLREKDERLLREAKAKSAVDDLRKDHDTAKALIVSLQDSEKQNKQKEAQRRDYEIGTEREINQLRKERDAAQAAFEKLQAESSAPQILRAEKRQDNDSTAQQPELEERIIAGNLVQVPRPQHSMASKQRKRADRNTNTVVSAETGRGNAVARSTRSNVLFGRAQVVTPAQNVLAQEASSLSMESPSHEMLDVASSRPESSSENQIVSSMQDYGNLATSILQGSTRPLQSFTASLDFSGNPLVPSRETFSGREPLPLASQPVLGSDFKIYEDSQDDGLDAESSVRANFTFRKPFPLPNSGSKRLSRTTSDKSQDARSASSRGLRRTPETTEGMLSSQARKTPETSKYPFGSSPEFMNPPSTKTKRRYSGNAPGTPGNLELGASRRSSTPLPDPRIAARPGGNKRAAARDSQHNIGLEPPAKKRNAIQTSMKSTSDRPSDGSFLSRSSQSISDLPRTEDLNTGRVTSQMQSSHMRSSAGTRRVTRNQKGTKDDAYKARFSQELRRP